MNLPSPSSDPISEAIAALRSLTQFNIQSGWRFCDEDRAIAEAVRPETWQTWELAALNPKQHVAWPKGQHSRWLGQIITVPQALQGYLLQGLCLRLALTWWAESAQVFVNGQLVQEGDLFDCSTRLLLSPEVSPGQQFAVAVRLISPGHDDGALVRSVCLYEAASPEHPLEPGFIADELAVLQTYFQKFAPEQQTQLAAAIAQIDWSVLPERSLFDQSLAQLRQQLLPLSDLLKQRCIQLVGHAHLDMAWLWAVDETWKAAERTFRSVLNLQQDFPELIFCHSTPALYEWMEQHCPELFQQIQQHVAAGHWELVGGLWVEPELNLIGGEAIARQILYGQQYFQAKFGSINPIAWLPDTFGFTWQLPQILKQGGIDYFVTQKMRWNDTTQFPHEVFWWQSPDGSRILSLMSAPIGESVDPIKMATYASEWEQKTGNPIAMWLPGVGDHGGGPTRDMLEVARRWQRSPFFPQLKFSTAIDYLQQLSVAEDAQTDPQTVSTHPLPSWNTDLYLEFHRGCYTTHADQKRFNRTSEALLYQAELFASLAAIAAGQAYPKAELEIAWKKVLFNQFHDILPGSSIPQVFVDANQAWQEVEQVGEMLLRQSLRAIAQQILLPTPPHPEAQPLVVFNSVNGQRSDVVKIAAPDAATSGCPWKVFNLEGQEVLSQVNLAATSGEMTWELSVLAQDIPSMGYRCFWLVPGELRSPLTPAASDGFILENQYLRVLVDPETGDLASVFDKRYQREVLSGPGNQLQAFTDQGQYWDAWNIDPNYADHPLLPFQLTQIRYTAQGELETCVVVERILGQSTFQQTYVLQAESAVLKISTVVDWQERHVLVKAAFPLNVEADFATYEIPCGAIARPTRPSCDREKAQWEVPALRWADLSDATYGASLLSDCKHGYDSQPSQLRLTLLRGAEWPDPEADRGFHAFTYALYPHRGSWQEAQTVKVGLQLELPLLYEQCSERDSHPQATLPSWGPLLNLGSENLVVMAFKQAEDAAAWVLRGYECHGEMAALELQSDLKLQLGDRLDLLERPLQNQIQEERVTISPWSIVNFKVGDRTN